MSKLKRNASYNIEQSIHVLNEYQLDPLYQATARLMDNAEILKQTAEVKKNCIHSQGWQFENLEVIKFNKDALHQEKYSIFATTTDSIGQPHAAADILIKDQQGQILMEAQLKSCNTAARSAFALSDDKYQGMQRVAPSEQHEKIQELYKNRIDHGTLKAQDYHDAQTHLSKSVSYDGISSSGTTHQEAIDATDIQHAGEIAKKLKQDTVLTEMHRTGHQAGLMSATISGGFSILQEIVMVQQNEKLDFGHSLLRITTATTQSYMTSYVTAAVGRGIVHIAEQSLTQASAQAIIKSNGHIALATSLVKASQSLYRYMTDENMSKEELLSDINHIALTGAGAFYYGAVGQVLVPIPVVGALVGSTVGYFIGNMIHQSGLVSLGESTNVKVARERREFVEQLCLDAIPQMRTERQIMEKIIVDHQLLRKEKLDGMFDSIEKSLLSADADQYLKTLTDLTRVFDGSLEILSQQDFDAAMDDDDFVFKL